MTDARALSSSGEITELTIGGVDGGDDNWRRQCPYDVAQQGSSSRGHVEEVRIAVLTGKEVSHPSAENRTLACSSCCESLAAKDNF